MLSDIISDENHYLGRIILRGPLLKKYNFNRLNKYL
jgi:hypothetical protein